VKRLKMTVLEGLKAVTNQALSIYSLELTGEDLQKLIESRFPIRRGDQVILVLKDPSVRLEEGNDRIGIELTVSAGFTRETVLDSRWLVDGELRYDRDRAEFFLYNPDIRNLAFGKEPDPPGPLRRFIAKAVLARTFSELPIYRLKETVVGHSLARLLLKSVRVRDGKLSIQLGLY
jgi:hypothetical protein